jgi:hypothetical protein
MRRLRAIVSLCVLAVSLLPAWPQAHPKPNTFADFANGGTGNIFRLLQSGLLQKQQWCLRSPA